MGGQKAEFVDRELDETLTREDMRRINELLADCLFQLWLKKRTETKPEKSEKKRAA